MKSPLYVRPLTDAERTQLEAERRASEAFRVRRAQIVLARAQGLAGVATQSTRPKSVAPILDAANCERLQQILHQSPRLYGKPTGGWTLALAAQVCPEQGVTARCLSDETIRRALQRLRTNWQRAQHWITRPDSQSARKKSGAIG